MLSCGRHTQHTRHSLPHHNPWGLVACADARKHTAGPHHAAQNPYLCCVVYSDIDDCHRHHLQELDDGPWAQGNLDAGSSKVVPVPQPLGGAIVLGESVVSYFAAQQPTRSTQIRPNTAIQARAALMPLLPIPTRRHPLLQPLVVLCTLLLLDPPSPPPRTSLWCVALLDPSPLMC